jgi:hypothetical protein
MSIKIFLSTVSGEFRAYRDQLRGDLTRHNVEVKVQEDFKDYGGDTLDKLDLYIAECDAVVHLVGNMAGVAPQPAAAEALFARYPDFTKKLAPLEAVPREKAAISFTQWEAWLALYHGKVLLIAAASENAPRGPDYVPTEAARASQNAHLERLRSVGRYPGLAFSSPDNLAKQIAYSTILDLLAKARGDRSTASRARPWISSAARARNWAIIGTLLLPSAAAAQSLAPPWPPHLDIVTTVVAVLVAAIAFQYARTHHGASKIKMLSISLIVVATVAYFPLVLLFTYEHPVTHERLEKGFVCNNDALLLYKEHCPYLHLKELKTAEYRADNLWTNQSILAARTSLVVLWSLLFAALACLTGILAAHSDPSSNGIQAGRAIVPD